MTSAPLAVGVVRTLNEFQAMLALRAIVYMGEQRCPFDEEFDGNDLAGATHLLATEGGAPVGAIRIRWFARFAKLERAAVLAEHRTHGVAHALWQESARIAARKGYTKILGHIEPHLLGFWRRCAGFEPRPGRPSFFFSGRDYIEVIAPLPKTPSPLTLDTAPLVLLRPEGAWDEPGVLDASSDRSARIRRARQRVGA